MRKSKDWEEMSMKKRLSLLFITIVFTFILVGCGKSKTAKHEYTISEFLEIQDDMCSEYDKKTEYWTDDEKEEKGNMEYIKIAKKYGFSQDFEMTISGCIKKNFSTSKRICLTEKKILLKIENMI